MTEAPSRLPATLSVIAIVAIVAAVVAIALLHGGGERGIAVPEPARTTSAPRPEPDSVEVDNADARLTYEVPKTWTAQEDSHPEVLGVRFGGAATYAPYPCGGQEYSRAFAVSAAVQSTAGKELDPRETAERFAREFATRYFTGAAPGSADAGTSEVDGRPAVLVSVPVRIDAEDPACQATEGLVTVLAIDLGASGAERKAGLALLVIVTDTAGGPDEPVPPSEDDLRAVIASARVS
ncbi:hypothetical protein ACFQV2_39990 [Actinokineospora soli]|uniref:DUF8017 domain-containing protein n=1 Tax=Actinokineospora soli TaxID=1048753 RepID=A0ABW2U0B4_9PSEU